MASTDIEEANRRALAAEAAAKEKANETPDYAAGLVPSSAPATPMPVPASPAPIGEESCYWKLNRPNYSIENTSDSVVLCSFPYLKFNIILIY
jgi:hypothetical protein